MRPTIQMICVMALAAGASACGKKPLQTTPVTTEAAQTGANDEEGLVELPAMQAAMRAAAGNDTIYFATDQSDLDDQDRQVLTAQARWLLATPNVRFSVEGHADERGTREYNFALGERRANAARAFLIAQGVPASRLLTVSWGKERPVAAGSNEQAWAQNRRAVSIVVR